MAQENPEDIFKELDESDKHQLSGLSVNPLILPKSDLGNITEERDSEINADGSEDVNTQKNVDIVENSLSPVAERPPSALPRSRKGTASRGNSHKVMTQQDHDLPNTASTVYDHAGPSRGLDEFGYGDQWSNSRASQYPDTPVTLSSPGGLSPEPNRSKSRIQIKDHGPVAKWLAKRQKKKEEATESPRTKSRANKPKYAPYIQPKVNTKNEEYRPSGGDVYPIRSDKLVWQAKPVVQTHNEFYLPQQNDKKIPPVMSEKLHWDAKTKIDMWNRDYKPSVPKKFEVFSEKLKWYEQPKINTVNSNYQPASANNDPVKIVDEELNWSAKNKVDTFNAGYKPAKSGHFKVFHEKQDWKAQSKLDNTRPHYMPGGGNIRVKTDKLNWSAEAKVDTHNHGYDSGKGDSLPSTRSPWSRYKGGNKATKENSNNNLVWSSHSSDSETEWLSSPGGSEKMEKSTHWNKHNNKSDWLSQSDNNPPQNSNQEVMFTRRKLLFNSKQLVDDDEQDGRLSRKSFPTYRSKESKAREFGVTSKVPPIKDVDYNNRRSARDYISGTKPKRVFKERLEPLPPVGTYSHRAGEPVVYPDRMSNNSLPGHQKIEIISMKDLSILSKKDRHTIFT